MDTKPLEIEAESYIKSKLIRHEFNVTKPDFDTEGADLLIVDTIKTQFTHILRIQCKGRNITKNGSNISIPSSYVDENFIVFLYLKLKNYESKLYIFFFEDIIKWKNTKDNYTYSFTEKSIDKNYLKNKEFNASLSYKLKEILRKSKIKKYTSVFIDSIFLNKAIKKTVDIYQKIYPEKIFESPKLEDVVKYIISYYDNFKTTDKAINILYVYNPVILQQTETIENVSSKFIVENKTSCNLRIEKTAEFVKFDILEHLERTINSENIILVADDYLYEATLNEFKDRGVEVTLVQFKSNDGRQMYTNHYWGDIILPLGRSIGLSEHEL